MAPAPAPPSSPARGWRRAKQASVVTPELAPVPRDVLCALPDLTQATRARFRAMYPHLSKLPAVRDILDVGWYHLGMIRREGYDDALQSLREQLHSYLAFMSSQPVRMLPRCPRPRGGNTAGQIDLDLPRTPAWPPATND